MRAIWNGEVIAESDDTVVVEGKHYFPAESVKPEYLLATDRHTRCAWKGVASYYSIRVGDKVDKDGAWYYPEPSDAAREIKDRVAFWHGVKVEKGATPPRVAGVPVGATREVNKSNADQAGFRGLVHRLTGR
jgi:uncharacterized protein (DUF427 family)